jgi:hypothetical protein
MDNIKSSQYREVCVGKEIRVIKNYSFIVYNYNQTNFFSFVLVYVMSKTGTNIDLVYYQ